MRIAAVVSVLLVCSSCAFFRTVFGDGVGESSPHDIVINLKDVNQRYPDQNIIGKLSCQDLVAGRARACRGSGTSPS
jgi:hypothetical protein